MLKAGQVVVLDKFGAHRTERIRELIESRGAKLLFLTSYSPDLNTKEKFLQDKEHRQESRCVHPRGAR